jgi:hypothetical protein
MTLPDKLTYGGDRMKITEDAAGTATITFDDVGTGRICGTCTLCCKLLPVPSLQKLAGERCKHQRAFKGCAIYKDRPWACRTLACRWLADDRAPGGRCRRA